MVEEIEIGEGLNDWFYGRPSEDAARIAARAACRACLFAWPDQSGTGENNRTVLPILRCILVAGVFARMPSPDIHTAARAGTGFAEKAARVVAPNGYTSGSPGVAAKVAADAARAPDDRYRAAHAVSMAVGAISVHAGEAARTSIWEQVKEDIRALEGGSDLLSTPLWPSAMPDWFRRFAEETRVRWQADPAFGFWQRWWDGVVSGQQIDWSLQKKVALITDDVWDRGPEAVAAEIARIEEQFRLLREVAGLRVQLANARTDVAALSKRNHNNPPELVEPVASIERQVEELIEALAEAETELGREAPRPAVLQRVGNVLFSVAASSLVYCAALADVALKKAAEEIGSTGAKALIGFGVLTWVSQLEAVQALARALEAFAKVLGGG